ncbi:MAG: SAM-dependent methyltransferase [Synechococcus sp.]|nr:SAM-dependent methyltransferase [Synechococcus sp.]
MTVPGWLLERLEAAGGAVPYRTFMDWVLHDPAHGAYGTGRLRIGPAGDFATAPSLGPDFAALLAPQLAEWLSPLAKSAPGPLALVETGPGEGSLALQLAEEFAGGWPELAVRTELVLVEPNAGMAERQRALLQPCSMSCRWTSFAALSEAPVRGVVLAHEVLDALAVERIEWDGAFWRQQLVAKKEGFDAQPSLRLEPGAPLAPEATGQLETLGLLPPSPQRPPGWCTELHPGLAPWLADCARAVSEGQLLVIDYALEAWRYYAPQRSAGTLMAYRGQQASGDPLQDPGCWDLTAHLCIESVDAAARTSGWQPLGQCRQGQALLALGLAERLHRLQHQTNLAVQLSRREALLRLVDPTALGDFRWLAYGRGQALPSHLSPPRFLQEPGP